MDPFRVLSWNVRGACSGDFRRVFRELVARNKPNIVLLTETRVGGNRAQNIMNSLGFNSTHKIDLMGFAGGIWLLWDSRDVNLTVRGSTFQELHVLAEVSNTHPCLLSFVYASPIRERRKILWENLSLIANNNHLPWMVCGDFNEVLSQDEKWGIRLASHSRIRDFKGCLDNCSLMDLGFSGCKFTWCNKRPDGQIVFERLDRFLGNAGWVSLFPNAINYHLPQVYSDHNPIMLVSNPRSDQVPDRPFRCEQIWLNHPSFQNLIHNSWTHHNSVTEALNVLKEILKMWNRDAFGNVFHKKNVLIKRLQGISIALSQNPNAGLVNLEGQLDKELRRNPPVLQFPHGSQLKLRLLRSPLALTVSDFKAIIDKVSGKLESWKSRYLSPMGKITMLNSVVNPMVSYYMQCLSFPIGVCDSIDKLNRNFFWNSINGKKKIHLVAWGKIAKPRRLGGLGIHRTHERNLALLAKLYWRVRKDDNSVWAKVGRAALTMKVTKNTVIGRCLRKGEEAARWGLCRVINNGRSTRFWEDNIGQIGRVRNLISGPLNIHDNEITVGDVINQDGSWNWELLSIPIPDEIRLKLQAILIDPSPCEDNISWIGNLNGSFSTKSAYNLICESSLNWDMDSNWNWVWKLGCHQILVNGLPVRGILARRGIKTSPQCPLCNQSVEDPNHLFRLCAASQQVWLRLNPQLAPLPHSDFFINHKIFEQIDFNAANVLSLAKGRAGEFFFMSGKRARDPEASNRVVQVKWTPPPLDWLKLNTDGSCTNSEIGAGGLLRDHSGRWISGFSVFIGIGNALLAELWAVFHGLKLASQCQVKNLVVEAGGS
ncbi:reverse transcriptase [Senna tora]|uniref:Reverse transcriptase n=1 Tax=Senna tora TaxID=362788 RepID=A0A834WKQ5_9FABA|nr:reverse transcriptase [Senna tora]